MAEASLPVAERIPLSLAAFGVFAASIGFGLVPYFSRSLTDQGMAPHAVAFYRYVIASLVLLPAVLSQLRAWRILLWGIVAGVLMGLGWVGYVTALQSLPASTLGVFYMTYPVFTVILAWGMFGDRPTTRAMLAAGLIVVAAVVAGSPASVAPEHVPLLLLALTAPLGFGFSICVLVHRLSRVPPLSRLASVSLGSVIGLAPLVATSEVGEVMPPDCAAWILVAGIAIATALIPQLIYSVCSPIIGASRSAIIGSVELPTMFAIGIFAFGEHLTWPQATACALILMSIFLTRTRVTRNVATTLSRR